MDTADVRALIAAGESMTTEFKRGKRNKFNDTDLVEAVVCLANGSGGLLLIGVEDVGRVIGADPRHDVRPGSREPQTVSTYVAL